MSAFQEQSLWCFYRQTTNGSYWHCLLLQGKNQSNFGTQLFQGNHLHNSKLFFREQIWDQHVTGSKFESLNFANFIWTFVIKLITFHLSIIQSQINLVKLANSFQVLFVNKANLSLFTGNVNYKSITIEIWSLIFIFHFKV